MGTYQKVVRRQNLTMLSLIFDTFMLLRGKKWSYEKNTTVHRNSSRRTCGFTHTHFILTQSVCLTCWKAIFSTEDCIQRETGTVRGASSPAGFMVEVLAQLEQTRWGCWSVARLCRAIPTMHLHRKSRDAARLSVSLCTTGEDVVSKAVAQYMLARSVLMKLSPGYVWKGDWRLTWLSMSWWKSVQREKDSVRKLPNSFGGGLPRLELAAAIETKIATWLILPVVIRLSKRLSHACVSINLLLWNCEWLIKSV